MDANQLKEVFELHKKWLSGEDGGVCANLSYVNLSYADLRRADLRRADLRRADLSYANLRRADLRRANLRGTDLSDADLRRTDLSYTNLRRADLSYANLRRAYLSDADLSDADLSYADLWDTIGNMREIKSLQVDKYAIAYTAEVLQIGCQRHAIEDWWSFDDNTIAVMDSGALEWWKKWKPILQSIIELSPAVPTKEKENA